MAFMRPHAQLIAQRFGTEVDEVHYEEKEDLEEFGAGSDDPRAPGAQWEDDDDGMEGGPQCAQQ